MVAEIQIQSQIFSSKTKQKKVIKNWTVTFLRVSIQANKNLQKNRILKDDETEFSILCEIIEF